MMNVRKLLLATALSGILSLPAFAQEQGAKNIILMVSDGIGFNGWLATDYYQGLAGQQSYQVVRPDGTTPVSLRLGARRVESNRRNRCSTA